jgi:hypothetical protein
VLSTFYAHVPIEMTSSTIIDPAISLHLQAGRPAPGPGMARCGSCYGAPAMTDRAGAVPVIHLFFQAARSGSPVDRLYFSRAR